jgi:hypothetical protein
VHVVRRLVRLEPPVPVEQLTFRGVSAGVKLGDDGVILWEPRPGGRECAFVYDTTVVPIMSQPQATTPLIRDAADSIR